MGVIDVPLDMPLPVQHLVLREPDPDAPVVGGEVELVTLEGLVGNSRSAVWQGQRLEDGGGEGGVAEVVDGAGAGREDKLLLHVLGVEDADKPTVPLGADAWSERGGGGGELVGLDGVCEAEAEVAGVVSIVTRVCAGKEEEC